MILENLRLVPAEKTTKLEADVQSEHFGKTTIWAEIDNQYAHALTSENYNGFLVALLCPAMYLGEDIHVKGVVSEKLLFNITHYVIPFIQVYMPTAKKINVLADSTQCALSQHEHHVGTGYSAGVDSLCTIYDHLEVEKTPAYKLDTLVFLNTGSHGEFSKPATEPKFRARFAYLQQTAPLPFIALNTNIHKFHEIFSDSHQKTVSFTNTAGVLILEKYFAKYYIASSLSYKEAILYGKDNLNVCTEFSDPLLLPLLSTENLTFIPDGEQYTRTQKTARIADYELAHKALNVCVSVRPIAKNCSCCPKCLRTLMTLESLGKLKDFSNVFDLKTYRRERFVYRCKQRVLYGRDPFAKDNVDLARERGQSIPWWPVAILFSMRAIFKHTFKRITTILKK